MCIYIYIYIYIFLRTRRRLHTSHLISYIDNGCLFPHGGTPGNTLGAPCANLPRASANEFQLRGQRW